MPKVNVQGVGVVNFPDSMSPEDIQQVLRQQFPAQRQPASAAETAAVGFGEQMLGNIAGLATLPRKASRVVANALLTPTPASSSRPSPIRQGSPLDRLQNTRIPPEPLPDGEQLAAMIGTPMQAIMSGQAFDPDAWAKAYQGNMAARRQIGEDNPTTDTVSGFAADAASLAMGRIPLGNAARAAPMTARAGAMSDDLAKLAAPTSSGIFDRAAAAAINRGVNIWSSPKSGPAARTLAYIADSSPVRKLAQGAGRAIEAGIEGSALTLLQDGDPLEVAGYAAGGQAFASLTSEAFEDITSAFVGGGTFKSRAVSLSVAALAAAGALQLLQSAVPGGEDNPVDSVEGGFNKVLFGAAMGIASEIVGRRASGQGLLKEFPAFADALQTIPRSTLVQVGQAISEDPALRKAAQNAYALSGSDAKMYVEAMESDDPSAALQDLMSRNERIRRVLTAPNPRLAGVPVKESD